MGNNPDVSLHRFPSVMLAESAVETLKVNGIPSYIMNSGIQFPGDLGDSYGADLFVFEKDTERAHELLNLS